MFRHLGEAGTNATNDHYISLDRIETSLEIKKSRNDLQMTFRKIINLFNSTYTTYFVIIYKNNITVRSFISKISKSILGSIL